ncbi:hypothetical protein NDU88_007363 [Pleurodeles waltl]|uniref:Uncharacterized protein n=1 Tax=Pleurodeles waltl TaxID=8319 RepID=A0AAV7LUM6_PLEWA|nr:hypothetical protein NDU88_007363 [Pleurodeles waltl]
MWAACPRELGPINQHSIDGWCKPRARGLRWTPRSGRLPRLSFATRSPSAAPDVRPDLWGAIYGTGAYPPPRVSRDCSTTTTTGESKGRWGLVDPLQATGLKDLGQRSVYRRILSLATTWDEFVLRRTRRNTKKHLNRDCVIACVFGCLVFGHLERLSAPPELLLLKSLGALVFFCFGCAACMWSRRTDSRALLR